MVRVRYSLNGNPIRPAIVENTADNIREQMDDDEALFILLNIMEGELKNNTLWLNKASIDYLGISIQ